MLITSLSGIRGIYGTELTDDIAQRFFYCYGQFLKGRKIVVGMDTRASSDRLKQILIDTINADFIDVGVVPTPVIELAVREYKADGGVIITASHNEPKYNGFKFLNIDGAVLREKDMDEIINNFKKIEKLDEIEFLNNYLHKNNKIKIKKIDKKNKEIIDKYYHFLERIINKNNFLDNDKIKNIKILIDPNGGAGIVAKEILERFGIKVTSINDKQGEFKRLIEPNEESLAYLKKEIKDVDFAAGFDCDADRVELMLPDGTLVNGNYVLALCVKAMNAKTVVVNDATSGLIKEIADVIETEVGEINIVDEIYKNKTTIGGEGSTGGVIIPPSKCRDGILTILIIIRLIIEKNKSLKEIIDELPKYYTKAEKLKNVEFNKIKNKIENYYKKDGFEIKKQKTSIKALKNGSFVWFRASKTESDILRIIADSKSEKETELLLKQATDFLL